MKYQKQKIIKNIFVVSIKMSNPLKDLKLSLEELKAIAKIRGIKDYKSMSEGEILSDFNLTKPAKKGQKPKANFFKATIEKIRKEVNEARHKFYKLEIKEIRKNLYKIENEKNLSESKVKEI